MDKLEELLKKQKELDEFIATRRNLSFDREEWIRKKCTALYVEVGELLDEVNYKWWKDPKKDNDVRVKEEIIDVLHFFLGICNDAGLSADEIYDIYMSKNNENRKRQTGESERDGYRS
ncbi:MAG: dUTPase [Clostridia bacterium]|nr:dUTPase [Clostridia bacterium]